MCEKTVFVTGGTRNSGLAIARRFAQEGYRVALSSRNQAAAEAAARDIAREFGVKTAGYALDLTSVTDIKRVFAQIRQDLGLVDVFVPNSAHLGINQEIITLSEEEFDDVMDVNIKGTFFCCQQAALHMKELGKGAIVIIGSVHYRGAVWGRGLYAASKGALATLVRSMAVELAEYGIRVNQVIPGAIRTERWDGLTDEQIAARRRNWPAGVESTGEDIANAVYYLASDQARTITGTELAVDSGVLACLLSYNGGQH